MEINVNEERRIVEIWLRNDEKDNPAIKAELKKIYADCKQNKYLAAVFESGSEDLLEGTKDLLMCNKEIRRQ